MQVQDKFECNLEFFNYFLFFAHILLMPNVILLMKAYTYNLDPQYSLTLLFYFLQLLDTEYEVGLKV